MEVVETLAWCAPDAKWHQAAQPSGYQAWTRCGKWMLAFFDDDTIHPLPFPFTNGILIPSDKWCVRCRGVY